MPDSPPRLYPIPVVRALIDNSQGRVLLLRRANTEYGPGQWCLPGGKVEYGQSVEEALALEIGEETCLEVVDAEFLFFQNSLPLKPGGMHCLNLYFHCRVRGEIRLNEESSEVAWVGPEEVSNYPIVFRNEEAIRRYFLCRECR